MLINKRNRIIPNCQVQIDIVSEVFYKQQVMIVKENILHLMGLELHK